MEPNEYSNLFRQEGRFWWYRTLHRLAEDRLDEARPEAARSPALLDAGCGTGGMLSRLAGRGRTIGLDSSPIALDYARRRGSYLLARGSVTHLPFRDATFDVILSLDVLYHRAVESDLAALREFHRCLRPGGVLLLNVPAYESMRSSHDAAVHTARRYRRDRLCGLLLQAGLRPERITHWNTLLFPGLALVRRLRRGQAGRADHAPASDVATLPNWLNSLLEGVLACERWWLRRADLPFGLSLMAVARRPSPAAETRA